MSIIPFKLIRNELTIAIGHLIRTKKEGKYQMVGHAIHKDSAPIGSFTGYMIREIPDAKKGRPVGQDIMLNMSKLLAYWYVKSGSEKPITKTEAIKQVSVLLKISDARTIEKAIKKAEDFINKNFSETRLHLRVVPTDGNQKFFFLAVEWSIQGDEFEADGFLWSPGKAFAEHKSVTATFDGNSRSLYHLFESPDK